MLRLASRKTMTVTLDLAGLQDIDNELSRVRGELAEVEANIGPNAELDATREQLRSLEAEILDVSRKETAHRAPWLCPRS